MSDDNLWKVKARRSSYGLLGPLRERVAGPLREAKEFKTVPERRFGVALSSGMPIITNFEKKPCDKIYAVYRAKVQGLKEIDFACFSPDGHLAWGLAIHTELHTCKGFEPMSLVWSRDVSKLETAHAKSWRWIEVMTKSDKYEARDLDFGLMLAWATLSNDINWLNALELMASEDMLNECFWELKKRALPAPGGGGSEEYEPMFHLFIKRAAILRQRAKELAGCRQSPLIVELAQQLYEKTSTLIGAMPLTAPMLRRFQTNNLPWRK